MNDRLTIRKLKLNQLDTRSEKLKPLVRTSIPVGGWIREIRQSLGMSARQLAARVGISQATLAKFEKGETKRTVSLKTLDRVAEALECKLTYALVPIDSFESFVHKRAKQTAERLVKRVSHSMELEKQGISSRRKQGQIEDMADEMARAVSKEIWEDWK